MNHQPQISVIVAVYKAENYLRRCLDSIRNQTFTDFEVLLIDDGSPDKSGEICEEYSHKDPRFITFHQENKGVSYVRQFGIDNSKGIYTIHIDPDDWVEPEMFQLMLSEIKRTDSDICCCGFIEEYDYPKSQNTESIKSNTHRYPDLSNAINVHNSYKIIDGIDVLWNKLIKLNIYKGHNISFPRDLNSCEDTYVLLKMGKHNIKICNIPEQLYHYDRFINSKSLSRAKEHNLDVLKLVHIAKIEGLYNLYEKYFINLITDIANEDSITQQMTRSEFLSLYKDYILDIFLKADVPLRRKLNILSIILGTNRFTRSIYRKVRDIHRNLKFNQLNDI